MFSDGRFGVVARPRPLEIGREGLDQLLGGGVPRGQLVELSGGPSSGKATLAFGVCLRALEAGQSAAWIEVARAGDPRFWPVAALEAGVSLDKLLVVRVESATAALKAAHILLSSPGAVAALIVDLPARAAPPRDRELIQLQRLARRSSTALVFLTERPRAAGSLGIAIALRLYVERRARRRLRVEVLRNKQGASFRSIEEPIDGPDRLRFRSSL